MDNQELEQLQRDLKFLLSFSPAQSGTEVEPGLAPMFYITLSYEGDLKLAERVEEIRNRYGIEIDDVEDTHLDDDEVDFG